MFFTKEFIVKEVYFGVYNDKLDNIQEFINSCRLAPGAIRCVILTILCGASALIISLLPKKDKAYEITE